MKTNESAARGQTMVTSSAPDRSSHKVNEKEAQMGRSMKDKGLSDTLNGSDNYNNKTKKGNIPK